MDMVTATKTCFEKYVTFSGRARRAEYWWFFLACLIASIVAGTLDVAVLGVSAEKSGPLGTLVSLAFFLPSLAVGSRRLHDINKSGWWQLLWIVFIIGWILLIFWLATKGDDEANRFGPNPIV